MVANGEKRFSGLVDEKQGAVDGEGFGDLFEVLEGANFGSVDDSFEFTGALIIVGSVPCESLNT